MNNTKRNSVACLLIAALVITFSPQLCLADLYGGNLTGDGGGIYATDGWVSTDTKITWQVTNYGTYYEYYYKFEVPTKALSHIIFEVSENFTDNDFLSSISYDLDTFGSSSSNPGIPGDIYGIKFDTTGDPLVWEVTFDTTRMPMWGNFYAKGGQFNPPGTDPKYDVIAYNTGFDGGSSFIAVPDTHVPVPPAVLLGILGMGIAGIKLRKFA